MSALSNTARRTEIEYLPKPFLPKELLQKIRKMLDK